MKKRLTIAFIFVVLFTLAACGSKENKPTDEVDGLSKKEAEAIVMEQVTAEMCIRDRYHIGTEA